MKIKSPESQNFGQEKIFFLLLMRFMRIDQTLLQFSIYYDIYAGLSKTPTSHKP